MKKGMKSVWNGYIKFGLITVPVKAYNANGANEKISFTTMQKDSDGLKKKRSSKKKDTTTVLAYKYDNDRYVEIDEADLSRIYIESMDTVNVYKFVDINEVKPNQVDKVYYLQPEEKEVPQKSYALIQQSLKKSGKNGVGCITINGRESLAAISTDGDAILLTTLKKPEEVRTDADFEYQSEESDEKEVEMLESWIHSNTVTGIRRMRHTDRYTKALLKIIDEKVKGNCEIVVSDRKKGTTYKDHVAALAKMISAEKRKSKTAS